ncbi:unnamed protein product, partial [Meganyctiphanes norvegica]
NGRNVNRTKFNMNRIGSKYFCNAAMGRKRVELYYDVLSPYTWYSFEVLMRYKTHWKAEIELKPFLLAGIMKGAGNKPPMMVPNKATYMMNDLKRCSKYFQVPLKMIQDPIETMLVKGSLVPNRFLTTLSIYYPSHLEEASRQFFIELWNKDNDFTTTEAITRVAHAAGLTNKQLVDVQDKMTTNQVKEALKYNTSKALEYGAFGSPTAVTHSGSETQMFFGSDRFPLIAQELGEPWYGPMPEKAKL